MIVVVFLGMSSLVIWKTNKRPTISTITDSTTRKHPNSPTLEILIPHDFQTLGDIHLFLSFSFSFSFLLIGIIPCRL